METTQLTSSNFRRWLGSRFFSNFAKQIQALVVSWQIYQWTKDPFALGLIGLAQALPFIGISLWAGHIIDRHEKRKFLIGAEAGQLMASLIFFSLSFSNRPPLILVYATVGLVGFFGSFENISASAYAQTVIPKAQFSRAAAWNLLIFQGAVIGGPLFGGWLLSRISAQNVYGIVACLLLISLFIATQLEKVPAQSHVSELTESDWARVKSGLKFIRSQPLILAAMSLDMVAVLFGDCVALFPIFSDMLKGGPQGLGLLRAAPSIGSFLISGVQSLRPFVTISWKHLKWVVIIFGFSMIGFALSKTMILAVFFLAAGGAADGISVIIRQSIYQALTPDHLRGRVASVSLIFISSSNEIGAFESGVAARLIGVVPSVIFGGLMTLGTVAAMSAIFRELNHKERGVISET